MRGSINRWMVAGLGLALIATPGFARDKAKRGGPAGNPGSWFLDSDYPPAAKRANEQGRVTVRISIDEQGKPTACDVTGSSGSAPLDAKTCELVMTRGAFTPQLDEAGKPVAYTYPLSTRWVMRDEAPPTKLDAPWRVAAVLQIDPSGKIVSCKNERSGPAPAQFLLCAIMQNRSTGFGLFARGGPAGPNLVQVTMEMSAAFDDGAAPPMVYEQPGREIVILSQIHFDVDVAGAVHDCSIIAQSGPFSSPPCTGGPGPFLPIEKGRGVTYKMATSRPVGG